MKKQIVGWALVFILAGVWYSFAQTVCTESRCYKLQDELGFYIDSGNPLPVQAATQTATLVPCNENRCVKLTDKDGNYITSLNPLPTTGGGGGGGSGTVTSITATSPLTGGTITTSGSIGCAVASGAQAGCLSAADWTTFNNKLSSSTGNGMIAQTSAGVFAARTFQAGSSKLVWTFPDGISGNPSIDIGTFPSSALSDAANIALLNANQTFTGTGTWGSGLARLTNPRITTGTFDSNGNQMFAYTATTTAVNYFTFTNAAAGGSPTLSVAGADSNIDLTLSCKGTCNIAAGTGTATGALKGGSLVLNGATSGSLTQTVAAAVGGAFTITWPGGTTDFTATGGTSQFVKQASAGAAFTVARPACADLSNAAASCSTDTTSATNITSGTLPAARMTAANMPVPSLTTGTTQTLLAPRGYAIVTGAATITVPVPAAGYEFCVIADDNVSAVITLAALGSSAMYENTARTAYGTPGTGTLVSTAAVGNKVCLLGRDSTHYLTVSFVGSWTAN